jgi:hypothetical protein
VIVGGAFQNGFVRESCYSAQEIDTRLANFLGIAQHYVQLGIRTSSAPSLSAYCSATLVSSEK